MAQHYPLTRENEPKIFKSVDRITDYFERSYRWQSSLRKDFERTIIYRKEVVKLSDEYKMDEKTKFVLLIGKYDLQNSMWWTSIENDDKPDKALKYQYEQLSLECHVDEKGKIVAIYMVA
jgi:hypothetical protein